MRCCRCMVLLLLSSVLLLQSPLGRAATGDIRPRAWLSWSPQDVQETLRAVGPSNNLYIRVDGCTSFSGASLILQWEQGSTAGCGQLQAPVVKATPSARYLNTGHVRITTLAASR